MRPADRYQAFLLDLDGVVYRGDQAVPGAAGAVAALRSAGRRLVFLTNNSARTPGQVADKLRRLGLEASPGEVVTSADATAEVVARMADEEGRPRTAFVIGERGIREALDGARIGVRDGEPEEAGFVVVGWDRSVDYAALRTATVLVHRGARLVATNADASYPASGGAEWPGAGAILAAVETASGARAEVVGKPHPPLFRTALARAGDGPALMVGDRIETDVSGAIRFGIDAALVLTGAAGPSDVLDHHEQPTMVLDDVRGLLDDRPDAVIRDAEPDDRDEIASLLRSSSLDPRELDPSPEVTVVAAGPGIQATASAAIRDEEAYLHSVAVAEESRGGRLGTMVTAAAVRGAAERGASTVYLLTESAEGFFRELGFAPVDRDDLPAWIVERSRACSESAAAMRRRVVPGSQ